MWAGILLMTLLLSGAGVCYLVSKISGLGFVGALSGERKHLRILMGFLIVAVLFAVLTFASGFVNAVIVLIHFTVFYLFCDLFFYLGAKVFSRPGNPYAVALCTVLLSAVYLFIGWSNFHNVRRTSYQIETEKEVPEGLRIAQIADAHIGTGFTAEGFAGHMKKIEAEEPDLIVITGDFADDSTTYQDFTECCAVLQDIRTRYGIFYVFGNHDKGMGRGRGYGSREIVEEFAKNGVRVLEDEWVPIGDSVILVGRKDRSDRSRKAMEELCKDLPEEKYRVVLDHQPNSYQEEAESGTDLVLSGHTHGGQFLPVLRAGEWLGVNDCTYGHEKRGNTDFIVTSGIADWAIKLKTGCFSEYVIIDIGEER